MLVTIQGVSVSYMDMTWIEHPSINSHAVTFQRLNFKPHECALATCV